MTPIESLNAYLAANPTAKAWVYEVQIRGGPGDGPGWGINRGAHFVLAYTIPGPLGDETQYTPPLAAALVTPDAIAQTPLASILSVVLIQNQQTIDAQTADLADKATTIATLTADKSELEKNVADLTDQLAADVANPPLS